MFACLPSTPRLTVLRNRTSATHFSTSVSNPAHELTVTREAARPGSCGGEAVSGPVLGAYSLSTAGRGGKGCGREEEASRKEKLPGGLEGAGEESAQRSQKQVTGPERRAGRVGGGVQCGRLLCRSGRGCLTARESARPKQIAGPWQRHFPCCPHPSPGKVPLV